AHQIAFHPLSENTNRSESEVLKRLKDYISYRLNVVASHVIAGLMHTAASPDTHKKIGGPKVAEYMRGLGEVKEKTFTQTDKILKSMSKNPDRRLVNIYLKHGSRDSKTTFARQAIVSFPIFDQFENDNREIWGHKLSITERDSLLKLLEYVFGDEEKRELYSYGSNNLDAPYFHALLHAFAKMAQRFNELNELHKKHLPHAKDDLFKLEWVPMIDEIGLYRGMIPSLAENEGEIIQVEENLTDPASCQAASIFNDPAPQASPAQEAQTGAFSDRRATPARTTEQAQSSGGGALDAFRKQFERQPAKAPNAFDLQAQRDQAGGFRRGFGGQTPSTNAFSGFQRHEDNDTFNTRLRGFNGPNQVFQPGRRTRSL